MVTLIHGLNPYQSRIELSKLIKGKQISSTYADKANGVTELIFPSDNLSIFGNEQKISIIRDISKNRKKTISNDLSEYIEKQVNNIDMIIYENGKLDARTKLYKTLKKIGNVIETKNLEPKILQKWIIQVLKRDGITLNSRICEMIIQKVGVDQQVLSTELDKLILLAKSENRAELTEDDLDILTENKDVIIFQLLDALTNRDKKNALRIFEDLYSNDNDFPYISSMLARQLKLIYWLKSGEVSEDDMKAVFKIHPYTIGGIKRNVYKFELSFIKLLFAKITNLDFKVKQGKMNAKLGLILLISSV
ncbi:MAG TPA: DNA polymerase III subunit delta [Candidatus Dojkabacteria bacterium]|nr:DNA polymerase III subunit delta [Candidatus Dojkabacteria bacterium]HRO65367.1 DNA polymerase III subunit delta [Candidatus Dojkabacteria bacterium]HRP36465.1 DNA polymerase III subunit delta [Candidatus Dojkabacteria bacterium]HRP51000.1 DNA polymerase III subunit delta [Candidatus Dojkabacteria bacterium]